MLWAGVRMNLDRDDAIELIKQQIVDQGCEGDSLAVLRLMQPHLFQWINLFGFTMEDLK